MCLIRENCISKHVICRDHAKNSGKESIRGNKDKRGDFFSTKHTIDDVIKGIR